MTGIAERRRAIDDPSLERLPVDDPLGVVAYVRSHRAPAAVLHQDILDSLLLLRALRHQLDEHERALLRLGERTRVPWTAMAKKLGLRSRQAAQNRLLRLEAAADPDAQSGRVRTEERGRWVLKRPERERRWFAAHGDKVVRAAVALTEQRSALEAMTEVELDWIDDVVEELRNIEEGAAAGKGLLSILCQVVREITLALNDPQDLIDGPSRGLLAHIRELHASYEREVVTFRGDHKNRS